MQGYHLAGDKEAKRIFSPYILAPAIAACEHTADKYCDISSSYK
jgi:hypothetical protein